MCIVGGVNQDTEPDARRVVGLLRETAWTLGRMHEQEGDCILPICPTCSLIIRLLEAANQQAATNYEESRKQDEQS